MIEKPDQRETTKPSALVARAQDGDSGAFADLVRRYRGLVFAVCFDQTRSFADSEELTQEVFLAAYRGLASLRETEKIAAWLQGIARNLSRMHRRRPGMELLLTPDQEAVSGEGASPVRSLELQNLLHEALQGVTERSREVLLLHYLGGYSYREIGALCSLPLRTVRSRLHEARAQLKTQLLEIVAELCRCSRSGEHTAQCALERCGQCGQEPCACVARLTAD
jgi:RNA polymerase sigma-70 factor (ECF subfamily)